MVANAASVANVAPHLKEGAKDEHGLSGFKNWLSIENLKRLDGASNDLSG